MCGLHSTANTISILANIRKPYDRTYTTIMGSRMKQTAVEWFYDKIKSHFEHDGDLLETLIFTMAIAKQTEKEQIEDAYKADLPHVNDLDAEQYYNETYKPNNQ